MLAARFSSLGRRNIISVQTMRRRFASATDSQEQQQSSEYSSSKEIGNPITWANPNAGPSQDDKSSNAWKWVYPLGFGLIIFGSLVSRYRNKGSKDGDETDSTSSNKVTDRSVRMHRAMERLDFATKSPDEKFRVTSEYDHSQEEEH